MQEILTQILGFIGAAVSMFSFQSKKRSGILLLQIFSAACFGLHFTLLGAVSGAALNFLALARAMVFYFRGSKKWASSIVWLPVFILCSVGVVALTWEGPISLLPMTGMILTTFAQYSSSAKMVRLINLPNDPCWLIYNYISGSLFGVITEILMIVSIVVGLLRHDLPKKSAEAEQETQE